MIIIETRSGSMYEIDTGNKCIRRLQGKTDPTKRVGENSLWKRYSEISELKVGQGLIIVWANEKLLEETLLNAEEVLLAKPMTYTSDIVSILDKSALN